MKSAASRNDALPARAMTSAETPLSGFIQARSAWPNVSGTRPGAWLDDGMPNCLAMSKAKSSRRALGLERPPVAMTSASLSKAPWLVSTLKSLAAPDAGDAARDADVDARRRAFIQQHLHDLARRARAFAEELAERLFVVGDAVLLDQRDEIALRVARQRRAGEVRVGGDEARGIVGVEVGEVAASAAGDEDFRADFGIVLEHQDAPAAPASMHGAVEPGRAGADDDGVKLHCFGHESSFCVFDQDAGGSAAPLKLGAGARDPR